MARRQRAALVLALVACGVGVAVLLLALLLGFSIASTPRAMVDAAKGQQIAVPAAIALITGLVALIGRRRRWAFVVGCVAAAAAVVAVVLVVVVPGG